MSRGDLRNVCFLRHESKAMSRGFHLSFRQVGKSIDTAFTEALNDWLRAERSDTRLFIRIPGDQVKLEPWRRDYNEHRPQGVIANKPQYYGPLDFRTSST